MKDRECISCTHFLMCQGKENSEPCINYEKRENTVELPKRAE